MAALNRAEALRTPESSIEPDPRTGRTLEQKPFSLTAQHALIATVELDDAVPEPVAIQFETARNLYLYAWHVYRFYMVAKTQALSALEFGLRERLPSRLPEPYQRAEQKHPMLRGLLTFAIDHGLVRNEGFRRWHESARSSARERRRMEAYRTMIDQNLESVEIDEAEPLVITPEDQQWNLVQVLRETLPGSRNALAHGGPMLTNQVLGTLELVAEILNQVYRECSDSEVAPPPVT